MYTIIAGVDGGVQNLNSSTYHPLDFCPAHAGEVMKIASSPDGRYLFTVGQDGVLFIYSINEVNNEG